MKKELFFFLGLMCLMGFLFKRLSTWGPTHTPHPIAQVQDYSPDREGRYAWKRSALLKTDEEADRFWAQNPDNLQPGQLGRLVGSGDTVRAQGHGPWVVILRATICRKAQSDGQ